jgi:hypothetical protein
MAADPQSSQANTNGAQGGITVSCPNCHTMMPNTMRFCRLCGFRLGEGVEEYTETVRLNPSGSPKNGTPLPTMPVSQQSQFGGASEWGPVARGPHAQDVKSVKTQLRQWKKKRRRVHWMVWVILAIVMSSVAGGSLLSPFGLNKTRINVQKSAPKSKFGVNSFTSADGAAQLDYVTPPGGPADKAGLLGGDLITSFDGQPVKSRDDIMRMLGSTPVGKTVDVVYIRDGVTNTTKLTTISEDEMDALKDAYEDRPEHLGYIGEGTDIDVVPVPGMNIKGVRLNRVSRNRPAYISGLRDGDIVIEFEGLPMRTRRELEVRIQRAMPDSTVKFVVIRNGERVEVPVKVGIDD